MPNASNVAMMEAVKADLQDVAAMWVVDYRGLTVKEVEDLRAQVREAGAFVKVYKNTVMRIALKDLDMANLDAVLEGPSAFIFCKEDPAAAAKVVTEFAKANKKLEVKGGMMENAYVDAAQVAAIAALPSKDQLLGQIASAINGVARGLATTISGVPRGLAQSIKQLSEQKAA